MDTEDKKKLRIANHYKNQWGIADKKNFPEQQIKHKADKIVGDHYKKQKNKPPYTEIAENLKNELSFRMRDGFIENNEGTARTTSVPEAIELNTALDDNLLDHQRRDYLADKKHNQKLERFGIEHGQKKVPGYPKVSNPPILQNNVNRKNFPNKDNPTVAKYKAFKEKQQKKIDDKKFDEQFNKEYSDKAIAQWLRGRENKNKIAGKHPYENFSTENMIVAEDFKDKAKAKLKVLTSPVERNKDVDDISEKISLLQNTRNQFEEDQARRKREYDKVMKRPVDEDLYKGLGNFDPRFKK